jgi:hypothetical protein
MMGMAMSMIAAIYFRNLFCQKTDTLKFFRNYEVLEKLFLPPPGDSKNQASLNKHILSIDLIF